MNIWEVFLKWWIRRNTTFGEVEREIYYFLENTEQILIRPCSFKKRYMTCFNCFMKHQRSLALRGMLWTTSWQPLFATPWRCQTWRQNSTYFITWYLIKEGVQIRQGGEGKTILSYVRFQVLTAVLLKIKVFWDVMQCRMVVTDVSVYWTA